MTKTKTARLSLTMPGPSESQNGLLASQEGGHRRRTSSKSGVQTGLRRPEGRGIEKISPTEAYEQGPGSSRSISPSAPFSAESDQSRSPASPTSPHVTSLPPYPPSPERSTKHAAEHSKSFFSNLKASKSSAKIQPPENTIRRVPPDAVIEDSSRTLGKTKSTPDLRGASQVDPVPDLPKLDRDEGSQNSVSSHTSSHTIPRRPVGAAPSLNKSVMSNTGSTPQSPMSDQNEHKKNPKLFPSFMKRSHGNRAEEGPSTSKQSSSVFAKSSESSFKSSGRDRSASRHTDDNESPHSHERKASKTQLRDQRSQSFRDGVGSKLFTGFKTHTKAAKDLGKAGKEWFKGRHTSAVQTPPDYMSYQVQVLNKSLAEQTRLTRIAKKLEDSKDKTEFWMPALPWRCIDYLNYTGCETEGLYRVPGSEREVKMWRARFDQEYDINLFDEEGIFDINAIGSLFKAWLRDLPEEVFPQSLQRELSAKYTGETKAPEELKDVLAALPPWNYYLLFAITCHLSLLNAHQDKNKMTFQNLFICFSNSLKLNADCFRWLVADWRSCWKGCITEKGAIEAEYRLIENYTDTFDSDDSSEHGKTVDHGKAIERDYDYRQLRSGNADQTSVAETFVDSKHQQQGPLQPPAQIRQGRKNTPSPINAAGLYSPPRQSSQHQQHSRESSRAAMSRDGPSRELPIRDPGSRDGGSASAYQSSGGQHSRSASQLPEFDFGKPISPTFASKRDSMAFKKD